MNLEPKKKVQCNVCGAKFKPGDRAIGPHRERHRLADSVADLSKGLTSAAVKYDFLEMETKQLRVENARLARLVVSLGGTI